VRVLIVEDNRVLAESVQTMLEARRFAVESVHDGNTGLDHLLRDSYDVAILDVMLPGMDGFAIVKAVRDAQVHTPVLMLTARDAVEDRVRGLDTGADDYLIKPFDEDELVARVQALVRRAERPVVSAITAGPLHIDLTARIARYGETTLDLGATEFRLIEFFARNAGVTFSRSQLLERVWDYEFDGSSNIVDVYVSQLRKKLRRVGATNNVIETVWGVGYRLVT